jgi:hypothetical protein
LISGSSLISGSGLFSGELDRARLIRFELGEAARAALHAAHLLVRLPWGQPLHVKQLFFTLPWGQGLQSAQLPFTLP